MIVWRNGKGGFKGGINHLIKGFFSYSHSITSASIITEGFVKGEVSVFSAHNGIISAINATAGEVSVSNAIDGS